MPNEFIPCAGGFNGRCCGAESPNDRCIGCTHDFGEKHVQQVAEQWSALISKLGVKTVEQVVDENQQLRASRDAWEKHYNERVTAIQADNERLRALLFECAEYLTELPTDCELFQRIEAEKAKEIGQ